METPPDATPSSLSHAEDEGGAGGDQTPSPAPELPAGLASGLVPVKGGRTKKQAASDITPVAIRRGASFGFSGLTGARSSTPSKFTPNVRPTFAPAGGPNSLRRVKTEGAGGTPGGLGGDSSFSLLGGGAELDIGAALAHSLALKRLEQGGTQDMQFRRAAALPGGAFGARGADGRRTNSTQAKVQQHLQNLRRGKKGKKSKDVSELSWATGPGGVPMYTPISLPYVAVAEEEEDSGGGLGGDGPGELSGLGMRTKRPTSRHIDEFNRHASSLFDAPTDEDAASHQWLLVQFPVLLPALEKVETAADRAAAAAAATAGSPDQATKNTTPENYQATEFIGLPEGYLGKLRIHRSGRVVFVTGAHQFQVNQGADCNFAQEIACLIGGNSELMFLGKCDKRVILTPEVTHYLS